MVDEEKEQPATEQQEEPVKEQEVEEKQEEQVEEKEEEVEPELIPEDKKAEIKVDFKKYLPSSKNCKTYLLILLILIPLFLTIFLRVQPAYLVNEGDIAERLLGEQMKGNVLKDIQQANPLMPIHELQKRAAVMVEELKKDNKQEYESQKRKWQRERKELYKDEYGNTYLLGYDPYQYYRHALNVLDHGHAGDVLKDGKPYDLLSLAPHNRLIRNEFHPKMLALTHKILHFFDRDSVPLQNIFFFPVILMSFSVILAFFIGRLLAGDFAGYMAALVMGTQPILLTKTVGGFPDTDVYPIFFILLTTFFFLKSIQKQEAKNKDDEKWAVYLTYVYAGLAGISAATFNLAYRQGWWIVMFLIFGACGITLLGSWIILLFDVKFKKATKALWQEETLRKLWLYPLLMLGVALITILVFRGPTLFKEQLQTFLLPFALTTSVDAVGQQGGSIWPNLYKSVAELSDLPFINIVRLLGDWVLFLVGLTGIGLLWKKYVTTRSKYIFLCASFITLWLAGSFYAASKGHRFAAMVVLPFSFGFAVSLQELYSYTIKGLKKVVETYKEKNQKYWNGLFTIILLLLLTWMVLTFGTKFGPGLGITQEIVPGFDDGWQEFLSDVEEKTPEDSIITTWWDYGHYIKAYSNRAVTFDGATQNRPQAYWVGRVFTTPYEQEAVGILHMLNCGGTKTPNYMYKKTKKMIPSIRLFKQILNETKDGAEAILEEQGKTFTPEERAYILNTTHCSPRPQYLLTNNDISRIKDVLTYVGNWNFERMYVWENLRSLPKAEAVEHMKTEMEYTEEQANEMYNELLQISDFESWVTKIYGYETEKKCTKKENKLQCSLRIPGNVGVFFKVSSEVSVTLDLLTKELDAQDSFEPYSIVWIDETGFHEKKFDNPSSKVSLLLFEELGNTHLLVTQKGFANSVFVKMFLFEAEGLKHIKRTITKPTARIGLMELWEVDLSHRKGK